MEHKQVEHAIIFGAAPCESWTFLREYPQTKASLVFCADGGIKNARAAGLSPDYLIGDWDSGGAPEAGICCTTLPAEKDMSDLQAAADLALSMGIRKLLLCGCTGGRLDHTVSNLMLLERMTQRGAIPVLVDDDNEVHYLDSGRLLLENTPPFQYLSILPLDSKICGVSLRGVKYQLTDASLIRGETLSVSNEPVGKTAEITVQRGRVLVVRSQRISATP